MSMTKERLAELRVKYLHRFGLHDWDTRELIDAVEALQAELAEERRKTFAAVTDYSKRLADEQTLHRETERQLAEERTKRTEMHRRAQANEGAVIELQRARATMPNCVCVWRWQNKWKQDRVCEAHSTILSPIVKRAEHAEKRANEAEDIANLAMRVGLEMLSEAERGTCTMQAWVDVERERAEKAERERDLYLADANEYALQIHDLRARLAACVATLEYGARGEVEGSPQHERFTSAVAAAKGKSDVGEISK